jgi:peptidoglycan/LPS O-acetylase OafA/YrhL
VCLFHAAAIHFHDAPLFAKDSGFSVLLNGHGAVILFFVLSGFVLRTSLEKMHDAGAAEIALHFTTARLFRLFPIIIATIALFAAYFWLVKGRQPDLGEGVRNALLFDVSINGAFWTLQVELFGSLIILIAYLLERRLGLAAVLAMLAILLPVSFLGQGSMRGFVSPTFFYTFLFGYLIAVLPPLRPHRSGPAIGLLILGLVGFYGAHAYGYVLKQWLLLITVFSSSIIVLSLSSAPCAERFGWPPVRFLGMLSYSFYALHPLGLEAGKAAAAKLGTADWPSWISVVFVIATTVLVTITIAIPMFRFVERPGIALGRRITGGHGWPASMRLSNESTVELTATCSR